MNEEVLAKSNRIMEFLTDHKCENVSLIELKYSSIADCFILGTVNSIGHLRGVVHQLWGELVDLGLEVNNRHKTPGEDGWQLIDCGNIVIHLMSEEMREFYSIEELYKLYNGNDKKDEE